MSILKPDSFNRVRHPMEGLGRQSGNAYNLYCLQDVQGNDGVETNGPAADPFQERELTPDAVSDTLLCLQTAMLVWPSSGSLHQATDGTRRRGPQPNI